MYEYAYQSLPLGEAGTDEGWHRLSVWERPTSAAAAAPSPSRRRQGLLSFGGPYEMVTARPLTRGAGCCRNYELTLHTP